MKYRVGIIGCGWIACEAPDNHLKAYQECLDTEVVALCDIDISKAYKYRTPCFAGTITDNYKTLSCDIVSVCTPVETHCQIVRDIVPFVKAIYCEKPIALTLEDADEMIKTCHKHNVILQINHQRRFINPKFRFSRGIIHTGTHVFDLLRKLFGNAKFITGNYWQFGDTWVEIEYVDTDEHIFELDCVRNTGPMILNGVTHLINCLKTKTESISSGEEAREALRLCLEFQKLREEIK